MLRLLRTFQHDESGATAIEYCLIGGLICLGIIAGASLIGTRVGTIFNNVGTGLQ